MATQRFEMAEDDNGWMKNEKDQTFVQKKK